MNPTYGSLSDAHGRSIFLYASPAANLIMRTLVCLYPKRWILYAEKIVTSSLLAAASIATQATLADVSSGRELALNGAKVGICAGLSFVVGPILGGSLVKYRGPRAAYLCSAFVALVHLIFVRWSFRETLAVDKRRKHKQTLISPFSFHRLLATESRRLRSLTIIGVLQTFCEPKTWNDMVQLYMRVNVGLDASTLGKFFAAFGASAILSRGVTRYVIRKRGFAFHTRMANLATSVAFVAWGIRASSKFTSVVLPLALAPLFMDRRAGVTARASDEAVAAGFGKGEHAGLFGNLRALVVVFAPLLFGNLYAWSTAKRGRFPGLSFMVAALFAGIAEIIHTKHFSLDDEDRSKKEKTK